MLLLSWFLSSTNVLLFERAEGEEREENKRSEKLSMIIHPLPNGPRAELGTKAVREELGLCLPTK